MTPSDLLREMNPERQDFSDAEIANAATLIANFIDITTEACIEAKSRTTYYDDVKASAIRIFSARVLPMDDRSKIAFIIYTTRAIYDCYHDPTHMESEHDSDYWVRFILFMFQEQFLRSKQNLTDADMAAVFLGFRKYQEASIGGKMRWPIGLLVDQIEKKAKKQQLSEQVISLLQEIKEAIVKAEVYISDGKEKKITEKIETLLYSRINAGKARPVYFEKDPIGSYANAVLDSMDEKERDIWFRLLAHSQKATGGKPTGKYAEDGAKLREELGVDKFKKTFDLFADFMIKFKETPKEWFYPNGSFSHLYYPSLGTLNGNMFKGLVWLCLDFQDKATLFMIAQLAERAYRTLKGGWGFRGPALGNACLYLLSEAKGFDGVGQLSRLKLSIKQNNTRQTIDTYLNIAAKNSGVSLSQIEDMSVDDLGLQDGAITFELGDNSAKLSLANGKVTTTWYKKDGSIQKAVPAAVRDNYKDTLKEIKDRAKQIEAGYTAQKNRIDRMFKLDRKLTWQEFDEFYFSHELVSVIARTLIWSFSSKDGVRDCIRINDEWRNSNDEIIEINPGNVTVSFWHPANKTVAEVQQWRAYLQEKQLQQPIKQAYREVYLLTDAEVNTRLYSNRMAAHILKQHQFSSLVNIRGWGYKLMGGFSDGRNHEKAKMAIPEFGMTAEYWIYAAEIDGEMNDNGIWNYVSTDQVRFVSDATGEAIPLTEIPKIIFSEIMRDVDLFVGVASIGNDATWNGAGGMLAYQDYWQSYSFGDLSELAKTRKEVLEKLLPKLKIASRSYIRDRFLVVKGNIRTYKIHIGSTNILMEPNDQYLCIVPKRSETDQNDLFLPFEGDNGLSVVISKALLLAEDDKITDPTILSQIRIGMVGEFSNL